LPSIGWSDARCIGDDPAYGQIAAALGDIRVECPSTRANIERVVEGKRAAAGVLEGAAIEGDRTGADG
jgi:hypothetical protein